MSGIVQNSEKFFEFISHMLWTTVVLHAIMTLIAIFLGMLALFLL